MKRLLLLTTSARRRPTAPAGCSHRSHLLRHAAVEIGRSNRRLSLMMVRAIGCSSPSPTSRRQFMGEDAQERVTTVQRARLAQPHDLVELDVRESERERFLGC
jgi:hypothetical protein